MEELYEPRQTGYKDIRHIDICEGDIVKAEVDHLDEKVKIIAPVIWLGNGKIKGGEGFYIGCWVDDGNYSLTQFEDVTDIEIVGNVRYDPLLEKMISKARTIERKETLKKIRTEAMKYKGDHISVQSLLKLLWRCQNER